MQQQPPSMQSSSAPVSDVQSQQQRDAAEEKAIGENRHAADGSSAAAASIPRLSTAQRFHTDGLHSAFGFLELKELPSVASVCLAWRDALYKERPRTVTMSRIKPSQLLFFTASPLARHVQTLDLLKHGPCGLLEVKLLQQLPSLTQLRMQVNGDAFRDAVRFTGGEAAAASLVSRMLPRSVTILELKLGRCAHQSQMQQLLVDVVSHQSQLTALTLDAVEVTTDGVGLSVLQRLSLLSEVTLKGWQLNEETVLALASLAPLRYLTVNQGKEWTAELLTLLTDPEHSQLTGLRSLSLRDCIVTAAHMQALAQLPALNHLVSGHFLPDALPLLSSLHSLTTLRIQMDGFESWHLTPAALVVPHLAGSAQLTLLQLQCFSITEADLQALVVTLPICRPARWDMLSCLRSPR